MAKDDAHFRLRLPETLKSKLEAAAAANNRSINAEIVSRLERDLAVDEHFGDPVEALNEIWKQLESLREDVDECLDRLNPARGNRDD